MSDLLDMKAAAEYLAIDYETFRQYVMHGLIPAVRYHSLVDIKRKRRKKLFRKQALDDYVNQSEDPKDPKVAPKVAPKNRGAKAGNYGKGWEEEVRARLAKH